MIGCPTSQRDMGLRPTETKGKGRYGEPEESAAEPGIHGAAQA